MAAEFNNNDDGCGEFFRRSKLLCLYYFCCHFLSLHNNNNNHPHRSTYVDKRHDEALSNFNAKIFPVQVFSSSIRFSGFTERHAIIHSLRHFISMCAYTSP